MLKTKSWIFCNITQRLRSKSAHLLEATQEKKIPFIEFNNCLRYRKSYKLTFIPAGKIHKPLRETKQVFLSLFSLCLCHFLADKNKKTLERSLTYYAQNRGGFPLKTCLPFKYSFHLNILTMATFWYPITFMYFITKAQLNFSSISWRFYSAVMAPMGVMKFYYVTV